jgi:hypothetical protein
VRSTIPTLDFAARHSIRSFEVDNLSSIEV